MSRWAGIETMMKHLVLFAVLVSGALVLGTLACQESDKVPPDDSTISLAASPSTILLAGTTQATPVNILATVYNGIGVPLPGQDVRFTNTSGILTPTAGTPVRTDSIGNAITTLTLATTTTSITAKSGKATATLSLQTSTCNIQTIALEPTSLTFNSCADKLDLKAIVTDTKGAACAGISLSFTTSPPPDPDNDSKLQFTHSTGVTDANGEVPTQVILDQSTCSARCTGTDCNTAGQAISATGGGITSSIPTTVITNVH